MTDQSKQLALGRWIRRELQGGVSLSGEVLDFIEATFGTRDLPVVMANDDSSEVDSMLELLFYPDRDMQLRFEARWGCERYDEQDQAAVVELLCASPPEAGIVLPHSQEKLVVPVPTFALHAFVQRLNICWQPGVQLSRALDEFGLDEDGLIARVLLRNSRLPWHADQEALVCRFLADMPGATDSWEFDLAFLISILSELDPGSDYYTFLVGKKFFYFKSLCRAEDYERRRQTSNMEIMMMQGERSSHGSIETWRGLMRTVDRICQALFGRTQFFQQPDSHTIDVQGGDRQKTIRDVISYLS